MKQILLAGILALSSMPVSAAIEICKEPPKAKAVCTVGSNWTVKQKLGFLAFAHRNYASVIQNEAFKEWLEGQPRLIREMAMDSPCVTDLAYVLTYYKMQTGEWE